MHRVRLRHRECSAEEGAVQSRKKLRIPRRTLRRGNLHPARPRGGWGMVLTLVDVPTGQATPSRNLVRSWVIRGRVESPTGCQPLDCLGFRSIYGALSPITLKSISTPDDSEMNCLPLLTLRIFIPSLAYRYLQATLYASTLRSSNRRIALA